MARTKHPAARPPPKKQLKFARTPGQRAEQETGGPSTSAATRGGARRAAAAAASAQGAPAQQKPRKPHRFKPGTVALREIRKYQKSTELLIPFAPFVRLVKEVTDMFSKDVYRWTPAALVSLQEAAEYHMVDLFQGQISAPSMRSVLLSCKRTYSLPGVLRDKGYGDTNLMEYVSFIVGAKTVVILMGDVFYIAAGAMAVLIGGRICPCLCIVRNHCRRIFV